MATIAELEALYKQKLAERDALSARYQAGDTTVLPQIQALNKEIRAILLEIEALQKPIQSAGQTVREDQLANSNKADPIAPNPVPTVINADGQVVPAPGNDVPSNAITYTNNTDVGTDGVLRPATRIQSLPATTAAPGSPPVGLTGTRADDFDNLNTAGAGSTSAPYPGSTPGAAAGSDDSAASSGLNTVAADLQKIYNTENEKITVQPNILDRYASYTYNISIYLTTPAQYQSLITNKRKSVSGLSLLMSSAGYPSGNPSDAQNLTQFGTGQPITSAVPGRNQFFPLDFYLDNVNLRTMINGKATGSAHSATELNFRVIEPNGITFIQNLAAATDALSLSSGVPDAYLGQVYLMVIRFYGYDETGKLVQPTRESNANQSDRTAIAEKFIPFIFTNIKFRITNRLTEYECQAICPQNMIGTGQQRGVIPYNIELNSKTLGELLSTDLAGALNRYQADFVKQGIFTYADNYQIKLLAPLAAASVVPPGATNITSTPMVNVENARNALLMTTNSVDKTSKNNGATAGMSIVQFIDQQVRTSDYIYKQQKKIFNPKTNQEEVQSGAGSMFAWYRIGVEAVPQTDKWDPKRCDYAYNITYQVSPYLVTDVLSDYFPQSPKWTAPKQYYHWFTGKNSQILDYVQDFNNLYYIVVNTAQETRSASVLKNRTKKGYQPNSNQSSQGIEGKVNEPGANAATYLYSPADLARVRMSILGDPDWIEQGDVWSGVSGANFTPSQFLPDGTINYESREVLFDVIFNTPADYNTSKGWMDTGSGTQPLNQSTGIARSIEQRTRYKAVWVTHNFDKGKFTQDIEGLIVLPDVNPSTVQTGSAASQQSLTTNNNGTGTVNAVDQSTSRTSTNDAAAAVATTGVSATAWNSTINSTTVTAGTTENNTTITNTNQTQPMTSSDATSSGQPIGTNPPANTANYNANISVTSSALQQGSREF